MRRLYPISAVIFLLLTGASRACNVPVFRYALERWAADHFEVVIFHRGPLGQAEP